MIQIPLELRREVISSFGKGDVLFWKEYEFPDGKGSKDSYIVFLTECIQGKSFLIVRGTANIEQYDTAWGRKQEIFRLIPSECPFLPRETVLNFQWIVEIDIERIGKNFSEEAHTVGKLSMEILNRLTKAIESAKTVERWKKTIIRESHATNL